MNKDFSSHKLLSMSEEKQFKILYDLASYIEQNNSSIDSIHFLKLTKYHNFLEVSDYERIQKLNKEFHKIKELDYQFQIYLMNLERALGQSTKEYQFLVSTKDRKNTCKDEKLPVVCLLDSIRSAHNVGAIFRTSECYNIEKIILTGLTPQASSVHVQKTAMGCDQIISSKFYLDPIEAIEDYKSKGYLIYAVETAHNALSVFDFNYSNKPIVLIFGHEQFGVSKNLIELSDQIISIPLLGQKNSLNVSISHGIILSQISKAISNQKP